MKLSGKSVMGAVILVILLAGVGYAAYYFSTDDYRYRKLVTSDDTGLSEEDRTYFEQQIATSQSALEVQKKTMDIQDVDWDLYLSIAWNASAVGDLITARETMEEYFTLHQINPAAYSLYGSILTRMKDYQGAEDAHFRSVELQPAEESYRKLISAIRNNPADGSREDDVKIILENAIDNLGQTSWLVNELAEWYLAHGDCDKAIDHYEVAQDLLPPDNEAIQQDIAAAKIQCGN